MPEAREPVQVEERGGEARGKQDALNDEEVVDPPKWPALTTKGAECKLCLKKGRGVFCHHHRKI